MSGRSIVLLALVACRPSEPVRVTPSGGTGWQVAGKLGVQVQAPSDAKLQETAQYAHLGNGTFKLNLFVVDEYSPRTAEEHKALIERELGFAKITLEQPGTTTWRFDYQLASGRMATIARIQPGGQPLDCGVYDVTAEIAAQVAASCAGAKRL